MPKDLPHDFDAIGMSGDVSARALVPGDMAAPREANGTQETSGSPF